MIRPCQGCGPGSIPGRRMLRILKTGIEDLDKVQPPNKFGVPGRRMLRILELKKEKKVGPRRFELPTTGVLRFARLVIVVYRARSYKTSALPG
jgi:hypothetical protein